MRRRLTWICALLTMIGWFCSNFARTIVVKPSLFEFEIPDYAIPWVMILVNVSFLGLGATFVAVHIEIRSRSKGLLSIEILGVSSCLLIFTIEQFDTVSEMLPPIWLPYLYFGANILIGIWFLTINIIMIARATWPRALSVLGLLTSLPFIFVPIRSNIWMDVNLALMIALPTLWLGGLAAWLITKNSRDRQTF